MSLLNGIVFQMPCLVAKMLYAFLSPINQLFCLNFSVGKETHGRLRLAAHNADSLQDGDQDDRANNAPEQA